MKRTCLVLLATIGMAACGDVTQPVRPADAPATPPSLSLSTTGANLSMGTLAGPGYGQGSVITQPGNYVWQVSSTSYNAFQPLKHTWMVSGDNGATWHVEHEVTFYSGAWGTVYSQFTRYIPPTANVPFLVKVVATHDGETATAGPLYVPVDFALTATVAGPGVVNSPGTYTWEVNPANGNGSYGYTWTVEFLDQGQRIQNYSTGKTLTLNVDAATGDVILYAYVSSGGQHFEAAHTMCNFIAPNDLMCA